MRAGKLEQIGSPEQVYASPRTAFVASFLGHTNLLWGNASNCQAETILGNIKLSCEAQGNVLLSIRPEDLCFNETVGIDAEVNECAVKIGSQTKIIMKGIAVPLEGSNR